MTFRRSLEVHHENEFRSRSSKWERLPLGSWDWDNKLKKFIRDELAKVEEYNMVAPGIQEKMKRRFHDMYTQTRDIVGGANSTLASYLFEHCDKRAVDMCTNIQNQLPGGINQSVKIRAQKIIAFLEDHQCYLDIIVFEFTLDDGLGPINLRPQSKSYFMDGEGRIYNDWGDYLANNKIPQCQLCYPANGYYVEDGNGQLMLGALEYGQSPACGNYRWFVDVADFVCSVGGFGCATFAAALMSSALAPIILPYAGVVSAVGAFVDLWAVYKYLSTFYDRYIHGQSISLSSCWSQWYGLLSGFAGIVLRPGQDVISAVCKGVRSFKSWLQSQQVIRSLVAWFESSGCVWYVTCAARAAYYWVAELARRGYRQVSNAVSNAVSYVQSTWCYNYASNAVSSAVSYVQSTSCYKYASNAVSYVADALTPKSYTAGCPEGSNCVVEAAKAVVDIVKNVWDVFWTWTGIGTTISSSK